MKKEATLMLLAATLAATPLPAETAGGSPVAAYPAVLDPLALIPADAEAAAIISFPNGTATGDCLSSVSIGLAKGGAKTADTLCNLLQLAVLDACLQEVGGLWAGAAREELAPVIRQATEEMQGTARELARSLAAETRLAPVYAILTQAPGHGITFRLQVHEDIEKLRLAAVQEGVEFVTLGDFSGVRITDAARFADGGGPMQQAIAQGLAGRTLYVLIGIRGKHAIYLLCEDPTEFHLAGAPENSILHTGAWLSAAPTAQGELLFAASATPELVNSLGAFPWHLGNTLFPAAAVFSKLAEADPAHAEEFRAAARGVDSLSRQIAAPRPAAQKPAFLRLWRDGGDTTHFLMTCDAAGGDDAPAASTLEAFSQAPGTIFCLQTTPRPSKTATDMGAPLQAALRGVALSLNGPTYLPEASMALQALATLHSGLGGGCTVVLDANTADSDTQPRVGIRCTVEDRGKLSAAWDGLLDTARAILTRSGEDAGMADRLPIESAPDGDAMSHTLSLPGYPPADGLNVTICDSAVAFGNSAWLNKELLHADKAGEEYAGTRFFLHIGRLEGLVRSLGGGKSGLLPSMEERLESIRGASTTKDGVRTIHLEFKSKSGNP